MRPIFSYSVIPMLPERLAALRELAYNVHWAWDHATIELFRRLDRDLWEATYHNPVSMLGKISQERLRVLAEDEGFLSHLDRVLENVRRYMAEPTWFSKYHGGEQTPVIAYFSAEFGVTECVPNYSGGLGVLAGDHLKSSSDLGIPIVGMGILYQEGYFKQYLNIDGWQQESYPVNDFYTMPIKIALHGDGAPVRVAIQLPDGDVLAQVWAAQMGRIKLYLLDTNLRENRPEDRDISDELYGGDVELRIRQEILLGIGGIRALRALGHSCTVCHLNEGHSAFLALERIRLLMKESNLSFEEARLACASGNLFTTHTPVPAGMDMFPPDMMIRYFSKYHPELGLSLDEFLGLGRMNPRDPNERFSMPILALRLSDHSNAVSKLHGTVSRKMWAGLYPGVPEEAVPIGSITNGIHIPSWISQEMATLFDRYLGPRWRERPADQTIWRRVDQIPSEELWRTHERRRERLVTFVRRSHRRQLAGRGAPTSEQEQAEGILDPEALTIGFARRFATYKRATLLFRNPDRLLRIITNKQMPVQIMFAGKAHPRDNAGKELIRQIIHFRRRPEFSRHIVFVENYDMAVARYLSQGVDVWLNTPRRGLEASGTSGMKVAANGGINLSILDGWWHEAYRSDVGWSIGRDEVYDNLDYQDEVESNALYDILEKEIIPLFFERGTDGMPRAWIAMMKNSMRHLCPAFNTNRMVHDYTTRYYLPAMDRYKRLSDGEFAKTKTLAAWLKHMRQNWSQIRVMDIKPSVTGDVPVGSRFAVHVWIQLGPIKPEEVSVQLYHGSIGSSGEIDRAGVVTMDYTGAEEDGRHHFVGPCPCLYTGLYGCAVRVIPRHEELVQPFQTGLILWTQ